MNNNSNKILVIGHDAGRTGAPIWLLNFIRWVHENSRIQIELLLKNDGELVSEYSSLVPVSFYTQGSDEVIKPSVSNNALDWVSRITSRLGFSKQGTNDSGINRIAIEKYDLIYSNTITNGEILAWLNPGEIPVISHVHELSHWIEQSGEKNTQQVVENSEFYIAASLAVAQYLQEKLKLKPEQIATVHSFVPVAEIIPKPGARQKIRNQLGFPQNACVIIGSGHETYRKGKDIFIELARCVSESESETAYRFLWIGGWESSHHESEIMDEVGRLGLQEKITFVGQVSNPYDFFAAGDIFAMVSREDPYPLVCLEAAVLGNPVICFKDAGGMPEFVEDDAGYVVPYLDVQEMAMRVRQLATNSTLREQLGKRGREKVLSRHDVSVGSRQILNIIQNVIDGKSIRAVPIEE